MHAKISINGILQVVSIKTGISVEKIMLKTRKREILEARQISHFFASVYKLGVLAYIGEKIGGKDHATVKHSVKTITNLYHTNREKFNIINSIDNKLCKIYNIDSEL